MNGKIWFSGLLTALLLPLTAGVIIAENGTSRTEIVTGKNPPASVQFAARELADFLGRAGKCSIPVRETSSAPVRIYLGNTPETKNAGIRPGKNDHIISVRKDGCIFLAGVDDPQRNDASIRYLFFNVNEKGTLETVYCFLEKYVGVRWVEPGKQGEYVPARDRLEIPFAEENQRPAFHERRCHYYQTATYRNKVPDLPEYGTADDIVLWGMRLGYTSTNAPVYGCHSFAYLNFSKLLPDHPELFALQSDGQRSAKDFCWSNPAVEELWFKLADAWFRGDKTTAAAGYDTKWNTGFFRSRKEFMIDPHDYQIYFCCCERCREMRRPFGKNGQGELIWKVIFNVARRIEKIHPGKLITTLVYPPKRFLPTDRNIPKNLRVRITVPWTAVIPDSPDGKNALELIRKWSAIQQEKVYLWMYLRSHFDSDLPGVPEIAAHNMQKLFRTVSPYAQGVFYEHIEPSHTIRNLDQYAISHLLWNPGLDLDAFLKEYFRLSFGDAAPEMEAFCRRLESNWYKVAALHPGKKLMSGEHNVFLRTVYDTVYTYQELTTLEQMLDAATAKVPPESSEARRIDRYRRYVIGRAKQEFSVFSSDKAHRFRPEQLLCTKVITGEPGAADWESVPWLPLHSNDSTAAPAEHSRFKVLENDRTFYVLAEFDEPHLVQAVSRDREPGDFNGLWMENLCELFFSGESGKVLHLVVNDRGFHAVHDDTTRIMSRPGPGIRIRTERGPAGWKMIAEIKHDAAGFSLKSNANRFNLTRTRALKDARREFYTWSKSAVGRWSLPAGFATVQRIAGAVPQNRFSGAAQAPTNRPATVLISAEKTKQPRNWRHWIQRGGKMTVRTDSAVGHRTPGSRLIDYARENPSGKEKTANWRYMIPIPERGSVIRVSVWVRGDTPNPNASSQLSVNWNDRKTLWLKSGRLSGSASLPLKSGWQNIALEIPVPNDPAAAYMSVSISGKNVCPGKLWIDDLQIEKLKP